MKRNDLRPRHDWSYYSLVALVAISLVLVVGAILVYYAINILGLDPTGGRP